MLLWIICIILGILTVAFTPILIGMTVKILTGVGRKFPLLADVGATITVIIVGAFLIGVSIVFAMVYHHIFMGM